MASSQPTTMVSLPLLRRDSMRSMVTKETCSFCRERPFDVACQCGDKFDFDCIIQHVEAIGIEYEACYQTISEKLVRMDEYKTKYEFDAARKLLDDWQRDRIREINEIAEPARAKIQQDQDAFTRAATLTTVYSTLTEPQEQSVHDRLNFIIQLDQDINETCEQLQTVTEPMTYITSLDEILRSKLSPALSSHADVETTSEPIVSRPASPIRDEPTRTEPIIELSNTVRYEELINSEATNGHTRNEPTGNTGNDEFDAGLTTRIHRQHATSIAAKNDGFAGTVCCHDNQLIYVDYDETSRSSKIIFINDITQPEQRELIDCTSPETTADDSIQDIIYSEKLTKYLFLTNKGLHTLSDDRSALEVFHTLPDRTSKRVSCDSKFIYLVSTSGTVSISCDRIILIDYDKDSRVTKVLRDIFPARMNRGAGPLMGEITDIAVDSNEHLTISYRIERRREVGICLFRVTNEGREWSCVKQLLLNECWHPTLNYTPRVEWCQRLNVFLLIEFMTGHLIMLGSDGQVPGECRFMNINNENQAPVNLTIANSDWLCTRYESAIVVQRIT